MNAILLVGMFWVGISLIGYALRNPRPANYTLRRRPRLRPDVWPDAVDDVLSAVRAGMSLPQAIGQLAQAGPVELRDSMHRAHESYLGDGDFAGALADLSVELRDPVGSKFCAALTIAYQVGGNELGTVLRTLGHVLRDDVRVVGELKARQSWTVNGARLAVAAPWVTALLLSFRSDAAAAYTSPGGQRLLLTCAAVTVIAYAWMLRIGRLPDTDGGL